MSVPPRSNDTARIGSAPREDNDVSVDLRPAGEAVMALQAELDQPLALLVLDGREARFTSNDPHAAGPAEGVPTAGVIHDVAEPADRVEDRLTLEARPLEPSRWI